MESSCDVHFYIDTKNGNVIFPGNRSYGQEKKMLVPRIFTTIAFLEAALCSLVHAIYMPKDMRKFLLLVPSELFFWRGKKRIICVRRNDMALIWASKNARLKMNDPRQVPSSNISLKKSRNISIDG